MSPKVYEIRLNRVFVLTFRWHSIFFLAIIPIDWEAIPTIGIFNFTTLISKRHKMIRNKSFIKLIKRQKCCQRVEIDLLIPFENCLQPLWTQIKLLSILTCYLKHHPDTLRYLKHQQNIF